jgi:hypothetical protein
MKNYHLPTAHAAPYRPVVTPSVGLDTFWPIIFLLMLVALLAGCASYPMGLTKEQWAGLTPAQQREYRIRQTEIDAENFRVAEAVRLQREQVAREQWQREQELLATRYAQARYRDIITVTIRGGMVAFHGKRFSYEPVSFDLVRGETKLVEFVRQGESYTTTLIEVRLSEDGNTFYFDYPARKRFVAVNDGWEQGREYHPQEIGSHDGHSEAVGVAIHIRYRPMSGAFRSGFDSRGK